MTSWIDTSISPLFTSELLKLDKVCKNSNNLCGKIFGLKGWFMVFFAYLNRMVQLPCYVQQRCLLHPLVASLDLGRQALLLILWIIILMNVVSFLLLQIEVPKEPPYFSSFFVECPWNKKSCIYKAKLKYLVALFLLLVCFHAFILVNNLPNCSSPLPLGH